jgi:hypothetical protein
MSRPVSSKGRASRRHVGAFLANILQTDAAGQDNTETHRADKIEREPPDKPDGTARGNT